MLKSVKFSIICSLLLVAYNITQAQSLKVPGVVVNYIPADSGVYIGSPSICILPNGDYVASHDHFGPNSTEHERAVTAVYKSTNRGKSWQKISEINGQFWSNLFVHETLLEHPDVEKHGFQYVDWQFDGRHIIFLSRTAYDDEYGGANNYHDANYLTFHRIKNFRRLKKRNL